MSNEIINKGLLPGMKVVGEKIETGEYFCQTIDRAKSLQAGMEVLEPLLVKRVKSNPWGKAGGRNGQGGIARYGKDAVKLMFEGAGPK